MKTGSQKRTLKRDITQTAEFQNGFFFRPRDYYCAVLENNIFI